MLSGAAKFAMATPISVEGLKHIVFFLTPISKRVNEGSKGEVGAVGAVGEVEEGSSYRCGWRACGMRFA